MTAHIECNKESFLDTVYLAKNYNVKTTIKCRDMSLKEYSEILKDIDLNDLFGTKYRNLYDIQRKILAPVKEELDMNSKLTFIYEIKFDNFDVGRPKATSITIDVIDNSQSLFAQ